MGGQCEEHPVPVGKTRGSGSSGVVWEDTGTGRAVDADPSGAGGTEGNPGRPGHCPGPLWYLGGSHDLAWQSGAQEPVHLVSDGDRAIARGLQLVYGRQAPHRLCHFHLLREYRRNIGWEGWKEARKLLTSQSRREGSEYAQGIVAYWCRKALNQGLRHLDTGEDRYKTTSRLERLNRELRRREKLGQVWSPHNLLALVQIRGLLNQTT